jgi:hypothetical protein
LLLGGKSIDFDTTTTTIRLEKMVNGKKSYIIFYYIENTFDGRGIKNSFHPPHSNILKDLKEKIKCKSPYWLSSSNYTGAIRKKNPSDNYMGFKS